jgi:uncharacterized protein YdaU (DUF1376 family)
MKGEEVKAYVYLLCEAWLQEPRATLPQDDNELAEMARVSIEKWQEIRPKVMANFASKKHPEYGKKYINDRLMEVSNKCYTNALNRKRNTLPNRNETATDC